MTINNSHKPIGAGISQSNQKRAGSTFGERRQLNNQATFGENIQAQKQRDFFSAQKTQSGGMEVFSPNAQFLGTRKVVPHKIVESGHAHARPKLTDDTRLAFLDNIIAGTGENRPPQSIRPAIKQTVKTIASFKTPIKTTGSK